MCVSPFFHFDGTTFSRLILAVRGILMNEVFNPGEDFVGMTDYQFKYIMDLKDKCAALEQELRILQNKTEQN